MLVIYLQGAASVDCEQKECVMDDPIYKIYVGLNCCILHTSNNTVERTRLLDVGEWESVLWFQALSTIGTMTDDAWAHFVLLRTGVTVVRLSTASDTMAYPDKGAQVA